MSTAVMPQSVMYDFGELYLKGGPAPGTRIQPETTSVHQLHHALSRVSSNPAAASLVHSILDNLQHRRLERTQSAPSTSAAAVAAAVNTSRYKTELCRPFEESGSCKYGDKCQFAHGLSELRSLARHPKYKTELCRTFHTVGFCPYGPRCHFVHNEEEARQHNRAVAAALAARIPRSRPPALSPSLSLGSAADNASPTSSLSQSPTSSMGSFFSSEPELLSPTALSIHHPTVNNVKINHITTAPPPSPPPADGEWRLPVFNRLAANVMSFGDLII